MSYLLFIAVGLLLLAFCHAFGIKPNDTVWIVLAILTIGEVASLRGKD